MPEQHLIYDNFYLANEVEDQYNSRLDLAQTFTVDNSLVGVAGMKKKINTYSATDGTEKLEMGEGNTKSIDVSYAQKEYEILLAQNRFQYYDEQVMTDPMLVPVGTKHMATDMFNHVNKDIYAELQGATLEVVSATPSFDAFVDAAALFNSEAVEGLNLFCFVSPADVARIRKALKDDLKYVESFVRAGYVGTVAGINIYQKRDAIPNDIYIATKEAVTLFNKKGTEIEHAARSNDEANIRLNTIYSRKYYLAALTDATKVVRLTTKAGGNAPEPEDPEEP